MWHSIKDVCLIHCISNISNEILKLNNGCMLIIIMSKVDNQCDLLTLYGCRLAKTTTGSYVELNKRVQAFYVGVLAILVKHYCTNSAIFSVHACIMVAYITNHL